MLHDTGTCRQLGRLSQALVSRTFVGPWPCRHRVLQPGLRASGSRPAGRASRHSFAAPLCAPTVCSSRPSGARASAHKPSGRWGTPSSASWSRSRALLTTGLGGPAGWKPLVPTASACVLHPLPPAATTETKSPKQGLWGHQRQLPPREGKLAGHHGGPAAA